MQTQTVPRRCVHCCHEAAPHYESRCRGGAAAEDVVKDLVKWKVRIDGQLTFIHSSNSVKAAGLALDRYDADGIEDIISYAVAN